MKVFDPPKRPDIVLTGEQRRVLIAWNPTAGGGSKRKQVRRLQETLTDKGFSCFTSTDLNEVSELSHLWWEKGDLRAVLGSGGDGTVRALAERSPEGTPDCRIPLWNGRISCRNTFGIVGGFRRRPFLAQLRSATLADSTPGIANGRLFVLMCSCGLDAAVVDSLHRNRKGHIGYQSYLKPLFQTCREYEYPELLIYCSETAGNAASAETPVSARHAFAFNFPCYAVGSGFAQSADPTDGILDVCSYDKPGVPQRIRLLLPRGVDGKIGGRPTARTCSAAENHFRKAGLISGRRRPRRESAGGNRNCAGTFDPPGAAHF